jgi:hypothetical protein
MLDKQGNFLPSRTERLSVLNWGTAWEIRRYSQIADLAEVSALDGEYSAWQKWELTTVHDKIDVVTQVEANEEPLKLQLAHLRPRTLLGMKSSIWSDLFENARRKIHTEIGGKLIDGVFQGPIENFLLDYKSFKLHMKSELAEAVFTFKSDKTVYSKVSLSFKTTQPSGVVMLVTDLPKEGWRSTMPQQRNFEEEQTFEFIIIDEIHEQHTSWAAARAIEIVQMLAHLDGDKVHWRISGAVSQFDKAFMKARAEKLYKDYHPDENLDNLVIDL